MQGNQCGDQRSCREAFEEGMTSQVSDVDSALGPHKPVTSPSSRSQNREQGQAVSFDFAVPSSFTYPLTSQDKQ